MTKLEDLLWEKTEVETEADNSKKDVESSLVIMNYGCMLICCGGVDGPVIKVP